MILDTLENSGRYEAINPLFAKAFEFLRRGDLADLPAGRREIDGDRLFAIVATDEGKGRAGAKLEAHRKYTDIQFCLAGDEEMGWKPVGRCTEDEGFNEAKDLGFFGDRPDSWATLRAGSFAVVFPADAHAVLGGTGTIRRIIVKVAQRQ
jgi:YhcH/YjgK/YiaL family protein